MLSEQPLRLCSWVRYGGSEQRSFWLSSDFSFLIPPLFREISTPSPPCPCAASSQWERKLRRERRRSALSTPFSPQVPTALLQNPKCGHVCNTHNIMWHHPYLLHFELQFSSLARDNNFRSQILLSPSRPCHSGLTHSRSSAQGPFSSTLSQKMCKFTSTPKKSLRVLAQ